MNEKIMCTWTFLFAALLFNVGAFALTNIGLEKDGFVESNPLMAVLRDSAGVFGSFLIVFAAYIVLVKLKHRLDCRGGSVFLPSLVLFVFALDFYWDAFLLMAAG